MSENACELVVEVNAEDGADVEELTELATRLQAELAWLDVQSVSPISVGSPPESSKGVDLLATSGLLVRFMGRQEILQSIIGGVQSWLGRQRVHSVKLTLDGDSLELSRVSTEEQDRLMEFWMLRHGGSS